MDIYLYPLEKNSIYCCSSDTLVDNTGGVAFSKPFSTRSWINFPESIPPGRDEARHDELDPVTHSSHRRRVDMWITVGAGIWIPTNDTRAPNNASLGHIKEKYKEKRAIFPMWHPLAAGVWRRANKNYSICKSR